MKFQFNGYFFKNEKNAFEDVRKVFLKKFSISENFLLHIHSISDQYSKELNEHYFQKDYPTDVLTIPLYKDLASINKLDKNNNEILGDLFLNRKLIKKHSKKYTKTLIEEYYKEHGTFEFLSVEEGARRIANMQPYVKAAYVGFGCLALRYGVIEHKDFKYPWFFRNIIQFEKDGRIITDGTSEDVSFIRNLIDNKIIDCVIVNLELRFGHEKTIVY